MARRTPRIPELMEKNELNCTWGLFSLFESCHGRAGRKLISNGRPANNHITDYQRKRHQLASFDEECRRIQNEADLPRVTVVGSVATVGNSTQTDIPTEKHETKRDIVIKRQQHAKVDFEQVHRLLKAQKKARKNSQKAYQSSSFHLNDASNQLPSASAEISLNKLTLAAILGAVCAQNHREESIHPGKYDELDEINLQQVQMSAKAFVDTMFIDRKKFMCKEETTSSESKSFSDAVEVLNSNKDLFMELFPDANSLLARRSKSSHHSQTEKETVKSVLDASSSEDFGGRMANQKGKKQKNLRQNIKKASFIALPSDEIVILKPARQSGKHSEDVSCHCSSLHSHNNLSRRVSDTKPTSFSFRKMKKKLKHTFGASEKLAHDRSTMKNGCICRGVEIRNSLSSSTNVEKKGNLRNKQDKGSDVACVTETVRKKLDFSSVGFSNKQELDVILEAKRHLSARLKNQNCVETVTSKRSPKTLGRILSSPDHEFWPLSPRRESNSRITNGRERPCLSPLRPNTEVASCDDYNKCDSTLQIMDAKTISPTPSIDETVYDADISTVDDMKSNGEPKIVEMNSTPQPELHISEVPSEINSTDVNTAMQIDAIELQKEDETVIYSTSDSYSENEASTSTADDFPSSPTICQLDMAESIKCQEEHRSPVSVLEPFFREDSNSPPSIMLQSAGKQLQPLRLDFDECSFESFPHGQPNTANSYMEDQYYLIQYVNLVLQVSCLDWDQLSEFESPCEELLHQSLFDEVELLPMDCYFDPKLLFDHINEVLLRIYQCHFCSPPWLVFVKPRIRSVPLSEVVLDEIMTEADFYLLPRTEKRTLDQLVSKDVANCRSWLDVRLDTEVIAIDISDVVLEESILDILLEFHA